ncbi:electron transfer flavoprotein subunit alpha [Intestinirhabdus alba]|jgi:electron transfer flavoprotein alpha subunit|uniref:Electron transfer flavoprotein subunit alpha n=1 Tax=Intestinirhabdus alba TaxID=2899544 RepID=A0A6L6IL88_9ENTR|nr:electron transfer flavoprotein subunit alpha [Intestinirhabdus alba]MTH46905.1 electron transfer flavoprotein subunit alpha [Intestinirhabdus alba]
MSQVTNVWVFSDNVDRYGELMAGARQWGARVYAIVAGAEQADRVMPLGADGIVVLQERPALQCCENYAETIAALIKERSAGQPALLLLAATRRCKALGARLSVQLDAPLVNDATRVNVGADALHAAHRMYGGLAFGEEKLHGPYSIISLAPGVTQPVEATPAHACPVEQAAWVPPHHEIICQERREKSRSSVDLSKARRVIGVGRGLAAQEDLKMVHALAEALDAEVGCSRPIAEGENWMERERYIGVSGVLLKSELYLTLGISGQIQHMVGGNGAKVIVAINKDKNAPIFGYADFGLVGDMYKVVPALIDQLTR